MVKIQRICNDAVQRLEGSLGCLLVEAQTGRILGFAQHAAAMLPIDEAEQMIKLCGNMFHGELTASYARSLLTGHELPTKFIDEAHVTTQSAHHFFAAITGWDAGTIMLSVESSTNIGLGWLAIRQTRERLGQLQADEASAALTSDLGDAWRRTLATQLSGRAVPPRVVKARESNALPAPNPLKTGEPRSGDPGESTPKANLGARSQMYRRRKNAGKNGSRPKA